MFDVSASRTNANVGSQSPKYVLRMRAAPRKPKLPTVSSLATSWAVSSDGMTYTFNLRKAIVCPVNRVFDASRHESGSTVADV